MRKWIIFVSILICILVIVISWYWLQKSVISKYAPIDMPLKMLKPYNILTYNIQKFPFSLKSFDAVVDLFRQYSIVMLQECFDDSFDSITNIFHDFYIYRGTLQGINLMNSGLMILSKFPILETEFIQFLNFNKMTFDALSEKGFLSVVLDIDGKHVRVINTHLQSCDFERFDPVALQQLDQLLRYVKINVNEKYFIIGGDFNIDIQDLFEYYERLPTIHYPETPSIYTNFTTSHTRCTKKLGYDGLIFDYFITSKSIHFEKVQVISCDYSDHNPVASQFSF